MHQNIGRGPGLIVSLEGDYVPHFLQGHGYLHRDESGNVRCENVSRLLSAPTERPSLSPPPPPKGLSLVFPAIVLHMRKVVCGSGVVLSCELVA